MALLLPRAVDPVFVKATPVSITLDFAVRASYDIYDGPAAPAMHFELQWREADSPEDFWTTASASLKSTRCTKGNLRSGVAYIFRARASGGGERWGPWGDPTAPLSTLMPELPDEVSELLKVPMKAANTAIEATMAKETERVEQRAAREAERKAAAERESVAQAQLQEGAPGLTLTNRSCRRVPPAAAPRDRHACPACVPTVRAHRACPPCVPAVRAS